MIRTLLIATFSIALIAFISWIVMASVPYLLIRPQFENYAGTFIDSNGNQLTTTDLITMCSSTSTLLTLLIGIPTWLITCLVILIRGRSSK